MKRPRVGLPARDMEVIIKNRIAAQKSFLKKKENRITNKKVCSAFPGLPTKSDGSTISQICLAGLHQTKQKNTNNSLYPEQRAVEQKYQLAPQVGMRCSDVLNSCRLTQYSDKEALSLLSSRNKIIGQSTTSSMASPSLYNFEL